MRHLILGCWLGLAGTAALAGDLSERADAYLAKAIEEHGIPAISAGIAVDGEIAWTGVAGDADADTPFRIASISKVLTAVAALRLAEQGVLDLEAPVQTYLPDYPPPRKGTMKVRHLLEHTSGIRHARGDESRHSLTRYDSLRDACRFFEGRKLAFTPGTKHALSLIHI